MPEWTDEAVERHVALRLQQTGLTGPEFDRVAIVADLRDRLELDAALDELLGPADPDDDPSADDPEPFDPRRP